MDSDVTRILSAIDAGDPRASEELLPLVHAELRKLADAHLARERPGQTLQATALVHEAWLKLAGPRKTPWGSRRRYFAAAAEAMRQILIDHARRKLTKRRGGAEARRAALELSTLPDPASEVENSGLLILDAAIARLKQVDPEAAMVVHLRYFAGLTVDETADALGVSAPTVKRTWAFARSWLRDAIESESD